MDTCTTQSVLARGGDTRARNATGSVEAKLEWAPYQYAYAEWRAGSSNGDAGHAAQRYEDAWSTRGHGHKRTHEHTVLPGSRTAKRMPPDAPARTIVTIRVQCVAALHTFADPLV